ncbi:hypothetical protein BC936DRAFT_146772 [Jimgerdemannia flammicorona]|uniref:Uncharacterized protein n=1 Tax=Jimgerdemannia flammicorona TaxID=994334 RepID=A0A433DLA2_9FUNG|nr:hypothetical protein BC936DRAFT_146772 [Jimgerdemannia flammicorona]
MTSSPSGNHVKKCHVVITPKINKIISIASGSTSRPWPGSSGPGFLSSLKGLWCRNRGVMPIPFLPDAKTPKQKNH